MVYEPVVDTRDADKTFPIQAGNQDEIEYKYWVSLEY